jgi:hypothetical protein
MFLFGSKGLYQADSRLEPALRISSASICLRLMKEREAIRYTQWYKTGAFIFQAQTEMWIRPSSMNWH